MCQTLSIIFAGSGGEPPPLMQTPLFVYLRQLAHFEGESDPRHLNWGASL
jgi:hypothetical protein